MQLLSSFFTIFHHSYTDDKVCVVGIFGKGSSGHKSKAVHANAAVEKDVFQVSNHFDVKINK